MLIHYKTNTEIIQLTEENSLAVSTFVRTIAGCSTKSSLGGLIVVGNKGSSYVSFGDYVYVNWDRTDVGVLRPEQHAVFLTHIFL